MEQQEHASSTELPQLGEPFCANCKYVLTGLTESSRCPECGLPLVDVLTRKTFIHPGSRRFRSKARILGMPAIDIAFGPSGDERRGRARGFLAIGDSARGVVAIGGQAIGVVAVGGQAIGGICMGGMSVGLLSSLGGFSIGGMTFGGFSIGALARGGGAVGIMADGGMAAGYFARGGGGVFGAHRIAAGGTADPQAISAFNNMHWFFGPWPPSLLSFLTTAAGLLALVAVVGGLLSCFAWMKHNQSPERPA